MLNASSSVGGPDTARMALAARGGRTKSNRAGGSAGVVGLGGAKMLLSRAVVLYGRVGTYTTRTATMKKGLPADERLWRNCAESIKLRVVTPWRAAGRVDVFVQSWNPELALSMNVFWEPRASVHSAQNTSLGRCPVKLMYCDRTMWALLGMKRALALRASWAKSAVGRALSAHATVLVMRHDVIWRSTLPPLRADRSVRLWLPFDCARAACRDRMARVADIYAEHTPLRESCSAKMEEKASNWSVLSYKTNVLGVNCAGGGKSARTTAFCGNSVNIDWWWAGDTALADGFGDTFDNFARYSKLIRETLGFHNSAPHHCARSRRLCRADSRAACRTSLAVRTRPTRRSPAPPPPRAVQTGASTFSTRTSCASAASWPTRWSPASSSPSAASSSTRPRART